MPYWIRLRTVDSYFLESYAIKPVPADVLKPGQELVEVEGTKPDSFDATHFYDRLAGVVKTRQIADANVKVVPDPAEAGKKAARDAKLADLKSTGSPEIKKLLEALNL